MKQELKKELTNMEDVDFLLLEHHFYLARLIRNAMVQRGINDSEMATILGVRVSQMKSVKNGAYPFDFILMAKLQTFNEKNAMSDAKFKIEAQSVESKNYKDNRPILIQKIEELINRLTPQSNEHK